MSSLKSPEDLAAMFGEDVTKRKVLDWMHEYDWPHIKVGRLIRFTDEQVTEILRRQTVTARPELPAVGISGQTKRSARRSA
jgi:hypothetical protein